MSHQRISVSAVVTLLVAVVAMGSLFVPSRLPQGGRRPGAPARVSRTAQRLDTADATSHDSDHQEPAVVAAAVQRLLRLPGAARIAAADGRLTPHGQTATPPAVSASLPLVDARPITGRCMVGRGVPELSTHLIRSTVGRAPPGAVPAVA